MLKNYLKIAFRNLLKNKGYSVINVAGLAIGLASCLLILVYLFHEWSYDRYHEKSDRIYRVVQTYTSEARSDAGATTPFPLAAALKNEYPQTVVETARLYNMLTQKLSLGFKEEERFYKEENVFFADSTVFDLFSLPLSAGNPETALNAPKSIILTESMVPKYFGDNESPLGETLFFEGRIELTVTGIMEDMPVNSHFDADFLISFNTLDHFYRSTYDESWFWNPVWTYILVEENTDMEQLKEALPGFADKYYHADIPETETVTMDIQPLHDIHLHSALDQEIRPNGDVRYLYIFSLIAVIILIVACVNFMNLSTARSASRAKEVGMRKTLGADRLSLFIQFMGESAFLTFAAFVLAIILVMAGIPLFNDLLELSISPDILLRTEILGSIIVLFLFVSLAAGTYPAIFLSRFEPVQTMRGEITRSKAAFNFRRILVVLQFSLSVFLIIGTILVYQQLSFLQNKKMGFDKESVVIIPTELTRTIWFYEDFKQDLLADTDILNVTATRSVLGSRENIYNTYTPEGTGEELSFASLYVMFNFTKTYDIELVAGRSFSPDYSTDRTQAVLINEEMVRFMNWGSPAEAIGKTFSRDDNLHSVIGVTENFHHTSLNREIEPLVIDMPDEEYDLVSLMAFIAVRVNSDRIEPALEHARTAWQNYDISHPFDYYFHDEKLEEIFRAEKAMGNMATVFSLLCILVACLGLFGLISFMTESRRKEIGIRKSLGASVTDIITLIARDYLLLIIIANFITWPVIFWAASKWLQNFTYRIDITDYLLPAFLGTAAIVIISSLITVSYHSLKAAFVDPAKTLKSD